SFAAGFHRHDSEPPLHYPVGLGKETMSADIDPIPFVIHSPRNSADLLAPLEDNRLDSGPGEQLVRSRQSGRAGSDNKSTLLSCGCGWSLWNYYGSYSHFYLAVEIVTRSPTSERCGCDSTRSSQISRQ